MKKSACFALLVLITIGLWFGLGRSASQEKELLSRSRAARAEAWNALDSRAPDEMKTKVRTRRPAGPRATHGPQRLKEFMLPPVTIDGLELGVALRKLMDVYEESCRQTGETPLALKFIVPPGSSGKMHLHLSGRNFSSSVKLLAALAGMNVSLRELTYQFQPLPDERKPVSRSIRVPPDITSALSELAKQSEDEGSALPVNELIRKLGLQLDPSTRLSLSASGLLQLEATSTADADMVTALLQAISDQAPQQHKCIPMVIDLPADADWTPPEVSQMTDSQLQMFIRELAQKQGTSLMTLPSVTFRSGQSSTIDLTREYIYPRDDSGGGYEKQDVGMIMQIQGSALGFGHDIAFDFTDTTVEVDPATGMPNFSRRIDVKDEAFTSDRGTRLVVLTRPGGSRAVVLLTTSMIDATGRPIREAE